MSSKSPSVRVALRQSSTSRKEDLSWFMGLIHLTRVFTTYVDDMSHWLCSCVRVFEESSSISSLDPLQIVCNTTLAHSHLQLPTGYELSVTLDKCKRSS